MVQNIVYTLRDYGVPEDNVLGIRYGLRGFYERDGKPITLTRSLVDGIHLKGGTMLVSGCCGGSSEVSCCSKAVAWQRRAGPGSSKAAACRPRQ